MSRIAFKFGPLTIYWYSLFVLLGVVLGVFLIIKEVKRQKMNVDFFVNLIFYVLIFGIIGARLYYVIFNLSEYILDPIEILKVWNGGLAIHGGILAGLLVIIFYSKKYKLNILKVLDIFSVGLIVGQIIGRWGNFFNQEAYGQITTKAHLLKMKIPQFIIKGMYIDGAYRQPTFLYESIWNLFGLIILLIIRRLKKIKKGQMIGFYMIWYAIGRFIVEAFRSDSLMLGNLKAAQIISIIFLIVGLYLFLRNMGKNKFSQLYNGEKDETRF